MPNLLVIEDGHEYTEFARAFLSGHFQISRAASGAAALAQLGSQVFSGLLIDLRFDRVSDADLLGDVKDTAARLYAGDVQRALRYLQDQQGILILAAARQKGHEQPAVFVHDFPDRRLQNLRKLYGAVFAVPSFDAKAILRCLSESDRR